jgi:hypothetical protein
LEAAQTCSEREFDSKIVLSPHVSAADVNLDSKIVLSPHVCVTERVRVKEDSKNREDSSRPVLTDMT